MRPSIVISALVALVISFTSSIAIVLAAAAAVGANAEQTASWVASLFLAKAAITLVLSVRYRAPVIAAGSTTGAAVIAATSGETIATAVGAFFVAAILTILTSAIRQLGTLVERIPSAIASAMLAGILFTFVVAVFEDIRAAPELVVPLVVLFAVVRVFSPIWAVLAVLVGGIGLAYFLGMTQPVGQLHVSWLVWIAPKFELNAVIGLGLPLYLVTMTSQNLPGFAALKASGYELPWRPVLSVTGLVSLVTAGFGAHASNLAAITASVCSGPDAHPDKDKRWMCGPFYAGGNVILALFGASLVTLFHSFPKALIISVAGLALVSALATSLSRSMVATDGHFAAVVTFAVTASGLSVFGIGSAFWGLVAGLFVLGLERLARMRSQ
ncbi:benzoate/H(+) symporter BenE family transporter [Nitratireductor sp. XY-223]|uniref:benzoate/H(+) symporter BenE family transporter n=1 Tax=Nitratireductor sp. XY-223 TaxID=2561926 RepID=UPI0010AA33FF|nr:benzoate/H(+) symporter BenE family transporter [Nitratireductor sp. XY-223]